MNYSRHIELNDASQNNGPDFFIVASFRGKVISQVVFTQPGAQHPLV